MATHELKIVLATFNYYPYAWGGSEVYVHGLALFLKRQGFDVSVVAAIPEAGFGEHGVIFEDDFLKATRYEFEGIEVVGCDILVTTAEIYSRNNPRWKASWTRLFDKIWQPGSIQLLHLHGNTPLISAAFAEAMQAFSPGVKTLFSYHVPETCPKGTLLYFNEKQCTVKPTPGTCAACMMQDRLDLSPAVARVASTLLPSLPAGWNFVPSLLKTKQLTKLTLEGFAQFSWLIDHWLVFSNQIRETLNRCDIGNEKITLLRHGIHDDFPDGQVTAARVASPQTFIFLGRFTKVKGVATLLKAWMQLPEATAERRLLLIGAGKNLEREIAGLLEKAALRSDVENLGILEVAEIRRRLETAHCVLVPSEWVEIGPLVLHEALACGANVLVSDVGGNKELAEFYGEGCQTFRMGDAGDLALKIKEFQFSPVRKQVRKQVEHYTLVLEEYQALLAPADMEATPVAVS